MVRPELRKLQKGRDMQVVCFSTYILLRIGAKENDSLGRKVFFLCMSDEKIIARQPASYDLFNSASQAVIRSQKAIR